MKSLALILLAVTLCAAANNKRTYVQTFNYHASDDVKRLFLTTAASSCAVTISADVPPLSSTTITITNANPTIYDVSVADARGVKVEADCDITLYGMNMRNLSADSFLGLSIYESGSEYIVLGLEKMRVNNSLYPQELSVVAAHDGTCCTYDFPGNVTQRNVNLNALQVDALTDANFDYTGTRISCNKKVSVFSGQRCTQFVPDCLGCDHTVEQLPPVRSLGRHFNLVPYSQSCADVPVGGPTCCAGSFTQFCSECTEAFRAVAIEDNTEITWTGTATSGSATLNAGESTYILIDQSEVAHLDSSKSILIGQYAPNSFGYYGNNTEQDQPALGDPSLAIVQRRESYQKSYRGATCVPGFDYQYANLVIKQGTANQVKLNGATFLNPTGGVAIPGTGLEAHRYQFDCSGVGSSAALGFHIHHTNNKEFGLTLFGLGFRVSYAHPAAL